VPQQASGDPMLAAVRQGMAELGYVEGKNFASEYRFGAELPQAAADLVRLNVNAILTGTPASLAAVSKATTSIPVVGVDLESDPVAKGYVKSLARPGGNVTGMFLDIPELSGKQVELLKAIVPRLSRIAIFGDPSLNTLQFAATETAARALNQRVGCEVSIMRRSHRSANQIARPPPALALPCPLAIAARKRAAAISSAS
jgi:putative tryptophan/tyrosine transport system substrate-binding protein